MALGVCRRDRRAAIILTSLTRDPKVTQTDGITADKLRARPPYLKFAFANAYNLSLLGGALAAAALTLNPILGVAAVGAEALWLLHAPGSRAMQKLVWDKKLRALVAELEEREIEAKIETLPLREQSRVNELRGAKKKIDDLAAQNPSFTGDL